MSPDFLPASIPDLRAWAVNFVAAVAAAPTTFGLTSTQATALSALFTAFTAADDDVTVKEAAFHAAVDTRATAMDALVASIRVLVGIIQNHPGLTDAQRALLRITVRKLTKTLVGTPSTAPLLYIDFSQRLQHKVHWGTNPIDERRNKKPTGVHAVELRMAAGTAPATPEAMTYFASPTSSPYTANLTSYAGQTVYWAGRYLNTKGVPGPWSDIVPGEVTA